MRDWLGYDPLSGHLPVFRSRRGDRVKLLWWDRDGLTLYYRRLEEGTFRFPTSETRKREASRSVAGVVLVLWGINPTSVKRQKRTWPRWAESSARKKLFGFGNKSRPLRNPL